MDERSQVMVSTLLGAALGAIMGGLYLTDRGRRIREQLEPALDGFVAEVEWARGAVAKARDAAREGRRAFDDAMATSRASDPSLAQPGSRGEDPSLVETTWPAPRVRGGSS